MVASNMPAAEVDVDEALVRDLLAAQHPDLAARPLRLVANGWDNVIFRLGDDLSVRLPRRALAAELVDHELRWLPSLADRLPLATPVPVRAGEPQGGYPWAWSVCRWLEGSTGDADVLAGSADAATALGRFVAALHVPAPRDAPRNPFRGVPLTDRDARFHEHLAAIPVDGAKQQWAEALAARPHDGPPVWVHGDLHPANLVVQAGRLAGVIDFGDLTAGDPATDLAVAWMAFDAAPRGAFRAAVGQVDAATWSRARGWAWTLALACLANSADNRAMAAIGQRTVERLLAAD